MRTLLACILLIFSAAPSFCATAEEYLIRNTEDLIKLCAESPESADFMSAIHFCHGYTLGAYDFFDRTSLAMDPETRLVCVKPPYPSRNKVIADFVSWTRTHPHYLKDPAVDTLFRYLSEVFPCR